MSRQAQYITPAGIRLFANYGSVTQFHPANPGKAAIVNAANMFCLGGGGVDGAITRAGGQSLHDDRAALPILRSHPDPFKAVRCPTGNAVITGPNVYGHLNTAYVIHAVGPNYTKGKYINKEEQADAKLRNAYRNSMAQAAAAGVESIAFSLLSAGGYRGDNRSIHDLLRIAIDAILECQYVGLVDIHLCGYSEDEYLSIVEVAYEKGLIRASG